MPQSVPTLTQIKKIIGKYSIASVRSWLKRRKLPHTMNSRDAMAERVHKLVEAGKLTEDDVLEGAIGIEEASSKLVFLYRIPTDAAALQKIDKQLADLKVQLSTERTPSVSPSPQSKLQYAINSTGTLRMKWNEIHVHIRPNKKLRRFVDSDVPKIIVLIADKKTGVVQIRCDKPGDKHNHEEDGKSAAKAYFDYYLNQAENMLGLPLEPLDFRTGLESILKKVPHVVDVEHFVDDDADGVHTARTQTKAGKDIRETKVWQAIKSDPTVRTFEEAPLVWKPELTNGKLTRNVGSYANGTKGHVRFDAHCNEDEIEYVLSQLV
jgi:hypothetical protein